MKVPPIEQEQLDNVREFVAASIEAMAKYAKEDDVTWSGPGDPSVLWENFDPLYSFLCGVTVATLAFTKQYANVMHERHQEELAAILAYAYRLEADYLE